jgi:hypothetical protein
VANPRSRSGAHNTELQMRSIRRIQSEIGDTFSMITGLFSLFVAIGALLCLFYLMRGESLRELIGQ